MKSPQLLLKQKIVAIDDHEMILNGVVSLLQKKYPEAEIQQAKTRQEGLELIAGLNPNLVIVDLVIPEQPGGKASGEIGIALLDTLMKEYATLNIAVLSANPNPLIRLKPRIDNHNGGFTVSEKGWQMEEIFEMINLALNEKTCLPKEMKLRLELKPEWLTLLRLAFQKGLTDKEIAKQMSVSEKTVQNYFNKVQDVLSIYPEEGQNLRILTSIKAREAGLID